jgi:hypothetical protein
MWMSWNTAPIPRWVRLGLIVSVVLLLGVSGAYTGLTTAQRIKDSLILSAEAAKDQNLDVTWQKIRVRGYPFRFRLELTGLRVRDGARAARLKSPLQNSSAALSRGNIAIGSLGARRTGNGIRECRRGARQNECARRNRRRLASARRRHDDLVHPAEDHRRL